jgi:predicted O-methyltransferase YrrM
MTAGGSSISEVRTLLRVLAGGRTHAAEIGTAFGEGAAAIADGLAPGGTLVTVESDPERARVARDALAGRENVVVVEGDWRDALAPHAPFDFLFVDGGRAKTDPRVLDLAAPGALFVLDDLTPGRPAPDEVRDFWLDNDRLVAVEILTTPATVAIVATLRA